MGFAGYLLIAVSECIILLGISSIFFSMNRKEKKVKKIRQKIEEKFTIKENTYFKIAFTIMILAAVIPIVHVSIMCIMFGVKS